MANESILWRGIDMPGHDACRLFFADGRWHLSGTAVFLHNQLPCCLNYEVVSDENWRTTGANVSGWLGQNIVELELIVGPDLEWRMNGVEQPEVKGCVD